MRARAAALLAGGTCVLAALGAPSLGGDAAHAAARPAAPGGAVIEQRLLGHSLGDRPIMAYRLGEPGAKVVVLLAAMHGNEAAPSRILRSLKKGAPVQGIDLWVVPRYNPDGVAAHRRQNRRGVDLNRNFPYHWVDLDGPHESGSKPASEPETRAMMRFLRSVKPARIISFHQPLLGVDVDTKDKRFARRLARALKLPTTDLDCGGVCHGTLTGWYNHRFPGSAVTVEYGAHPSRRTLTRQAPRALIDLLGGTRGGAG